MPVVWRIVKAKHVDAAISGEGAALAGGRRNSRGVRVVYASSTQAWAVLELLVHLNPMPRLDLRLFQVEFPDSDVQVVPDSQLPGDRRAHPPPPSTQQVGDAWVAAAGSAVLALPGVLTGERNYLLNPAHPGFARLRIDSPQVLDLDPRLAH